MEGPVVGGSIAEESDGHLLGFAKREAIPSAGGLQDRRADDAARAHHADLGREQVHRAAATTGAAGLAAEQLGKQFARGHAFRERMTMAAVRAEDGIVPVEMGADTGGNRLLPDVGVARSVHKPARMAARELLFARANQLHRAVERHAHRGLRREPPAFIARLPPSIGMIAPVIHLEASEASSTAKPWTSVGWPKRPVGMLLRNFSRAPASWQSVLPRSGSAPVPEGSR